MKTPIIIESFHTPESSGGFNWTLDTPENRERFTEEARKDAVDYANVIVIAVSLDLPDDFMPSDVTDMLDAELVFESGQVGEILFRSREGE